MADPVAPGVLIVRDLGVRDYEQVWRAMSEFTDRRDANSNDELWLVEHPAVFTLGKAGKTEHLLCPGDIPVVQSDRGGQVTHHAPGQLVAYPLIDIRRRGLSVRELVHRTEGAIIATLALVGIEGCARADAPGVYVDGAKIASLGFRIRRGCSFHGLSLNVAMDLSGFQRINPCGFAGLQMVQTSALSRDRRASDVGQMSDLLVEQFAAQLGYGDHRMATEGSQDPGDYQDSPHRQTQTVSAGGAT